MLLAGLGQRPRRAMGSLSELISKVLEIVSKLIDYLKLSREVEKEKVVSNVSAANEIIEGKQARDELVTNPNNAVVLLGEILIRDSNATNRVANSEDERQLVLSELPGGVPERDGQSVNYKGHTYELRDLETLVYKFSTRSLKALATCLPQLQFVVRELAMEFDVTVLEGTRSLADQQKAFDSGKSKVKPGQSKHNSTPSFAVDICPADAPKAWAEGKDLPRSRYNEMMLRAIEIGKEHGISLRWGGDWDGDRVFTDQTFNDLVHLEVLNV